MLSDLYLLAYVIAILMVGYGVVSIACDFINQFVAATLIASDKQELLGFEDEEIDDFEFVPFQPTDYLKYIAAFAYVIGYHFLR